MKKISRICIVFLLCFIMAAGEIFAVTASDGLNKILSDLTSGINAVVIYDVTENKTVFAKNEKRRISIASTTKLMTCLVALRYVSPDEVFTVGKEIEMRKPNSSIAGLSYNAYGNVPHKLKLRTLIAALLLPSGNDAAYTVAVNVAKLHSGNSRLGNEEAVKYFCSLMNDYAKELGCKNTSFVNPEGWDDSNHYSTADDMKLIALEAMKNVFITSTAKISQDRFTFASGHWIEWKNSNKLLHKTIDGEQNPYYYEYATGLKTGTTNAAGNCLVATAEKNGKQLLLLIYGAATENDRYARARDIFEYAFSAPITGDVKLTGDVNADGSITAADARIVLRASVGLEKITPFLLEKGDIDKSGKLTAADARTILRASVGLEKIN